MDTEGTALHDFGAGVAVNSQGQIIQLGALGPTGPNFDTFLKCYNASGTVLWELKFDNAQSIQGVSLELDNADNIYIAGEFTGSTDLDPGVGVDLHTPVGNGDIFLVKLDPSGNYLWGKSFGGGSWELCEEISISGNNLFVLGSFRSTTDLNPGAEKDEFTASGIGYDVFVSKLNLDGDYVWGRAIGSSSIDAASSIEALSNGHVVFSTIFFGSLDVDPGAATTMESSKGNNDALIECLDENGSLVWYQVLGSSSRNYANTITSNNNELVVGGQFGGTIDFNSGASVNELTATGTDGFVLKLALNGTYQWAKNFGGAGSVDVLSLAFDDQQNLYLAGTFEGESNFSTNGSDNKYTSEGGRDGYLAQMNPTGDFAWVYTFGATIQDRATDVAVDADGRVFGTGSYWNAVDFNKGGAAKVENTVGEDDAFLVMLSPINLSQKEIIDLEINLYPNPIVDRINFRVTNGFFDGTVLIYNAQGKIVHKKEILKESEMSIDLNTLSPGVYNVVFVNPKHSYRHSGGLFVKK